MKILIIYAHPEPGSLNGFLKELACDFLRSLGHQVIVSDLYRMKWKAVADGGDFLNFDTNERLFYMRQSGVAYHQGLQTSDIADEQEKLLWADIVIFQFPLWWFSMPAILKGWIDRVYAFGFAYGTGKYGGKHWGNRYGEGTLQGKKAMLSVTIGGRKPQYEERGINGNIDDLLFPIHHGILWYPGMSVLPPHIIFQADSMDHERLNKQVKEYKQRLENLENTDVIPFRFQNYGDYDEHQQLKQGLSKGKKGFSIHVGD